MLASALPADPGLLDLVVFQINGLIVVTLALGLIWGLMEISGACFRKSAAAASARSPAPNPEGSATNTPLAPPAGAGPSPLHVALITAAVHATLGPRARVVALAKPHAPEWAAEGRRAIFATHKVR
jgi:hypothetical protein